MQVYEGLRNILCFKISAFSWTSLASCQVSISFMRETVGSKLKFKFDTKYGLQQLTLYQSLVYLHAKSKYCDDDFKNQSQGELPHCSVDSRTCRSVRNVIYRSGHIWVIDIITKLWGLQSATVIEKFRDQLTGTSPGVRIRIGDDGSDGSYHNDL